MSVSDVLDEIRQSMPYISGITVSGGEATVQNEFVAELFKEIKAQPDFNGLTTFIDSNGNLFVPVISASEILDIDLPYYLLLV